MTAGGPGGDFWGQFFDYFFLFFHQCNNINITYQQFYCCLHWYLTHSYSLLCFDVFLPPLKSTLLVTENVSRRRLWSFWPSRLKQTSFCRKLNYLDRHIHFLNIRSLSSKNKQRKQKICKKCNLKKKYILLKFLFFINS